MSITISADDFPTPSKPSYDLNYSPSINSNALTHVANPLHFTPVTPDQAAKMESQLSTILKSTIYESTSQERDKTKNLIESTGDEATHRHHDELLHNIVDSSSTVISTPYKEKNDSDKITDLGIDLNKTPQQKPPKRRKHRPKVIVEGKPKRGRKPAIPKTTEPKENQTGKRKYVRKNVPKDPTAQVADASVEARDANTRMRQKSCKRVLNFDLEKMGDENQGNIVAQQEVQNTNGNTTNVTLDYQGTAFCNGTNHLTGTSSSMQSGIPKTVMIENHFMNQMPNGNFPPLDGQVAVAPIHLMNDMQTRDFIVTGRHEINRNVGQQQKRKEAKHILEQQNTTCGEGIVQDSVRGKDNCEKLQKIRKPMKQITPQPLVPKTPSSHEARGSKREHSHTIEQVHVSTTNHMDASTMLYQRLFQICTGFSQTHKKTKIGDDHINTQNMHSNVKAAEGFGNPETRAFDVNANGLTPTQDCTILNSHLSRIAERENNEVSKFTSDRYIHAIPSGHNSPKKQILSKPHSHTERMGSASALSQVNSLSTKSTFENNHLIPSLRENSTGAANGQLFRTCYNSMSGMKQIVRAPLIKSAVSEMDTVQEPSPKKRGTFLV